MTFMFEEVKWELGLCVEGRGGALSCGECEKSQGFKTQALSSRGPFCLCYTRWFLLLTSDFIQFWVPASHLVRSLGYLRIRSWGSHLIVSQRRCDRAQSTGFPHRRPCFESWQLTLIKSVTLASHLSSSYFSVFQSIHYKMKILLSFVLSTY